MTSARITATVGNASGALPARGIGDRLNEAGEVEYTTTYAYDDDGRLLPQ